LVRIGSEISYFGGISLYKVLLNGGDRGLRLPKASIEAMRLR